MAQPSPIRVLMLAFGLWMALQTTLRFGGTLLTVIVVCVAGLMSWTIYSLRHDRAAAARWFQASWAQPWFKVVCWMSHQQLPNDVASDGSSSVLQLATTEDFQWCGRKLKESVFGHDAVIDAILGHVETAVRLRSHRTDGHEPSPLGAFLLAGANGIGKKWLAANVGQRVFRSTELLALSMTNYSDDQAAQRLFGSEQQDGLLTMSLRRQPSLTIVFENIEAAHSTVLETLQSAIQDGLPSRGRVADVSLQNSLVFLTTNLSPESSNNGTPCAQAELTAYLSQSANWSRAVLSALTDCLHLQPLGDVEKAQVMVQLMAAECSKYGLKLEFVEPEVVVAEVELYSPELGFEHSRQRVARWLKNVIQKATSSGAECLVLTTRLAQHAGCTVTVPTSSQRMAANGGAKTISTLL